MYTENDYHYFEDTFVLDDDDRRHFPSEDDNDNDEDVKYDEDLETAKEN